MKKLINRTFSAIAALSLVTMALMLGGCGGSDGTLSSEVVTGTAAVGAPLAGQVSLRDSSIPTREKTAILAADGSFAFDVAGMTAPFVMQARGSAGGKQYKLHSYAEGTGIANVNPLSDVIVACAAEVDEPSDAYEKDDSDKRRKIRANFARTVETVLSKLQPLLARYGAHHKNPITSRFIANHLELDEMFDNVKITAAKGTISIINEKTGAVIYSGMISDIANGNFYPDNVPPAPAAPSAPATLTAVGGTGEVTLAWESVSDATSYNVYYATSSEVSAANGMKIAASTNNYVHTGLTAGTTYYYVVTSVNSTGESAASTQTQASVSAETPVPTVPQAPTGVTATGGTKQATITWPAVSGAVWYNIYWSNSADVSIATGAKLTNAVSPAVHAGLTDGTTYYYIVTAVNDVGESAPSVRVAASTLASVPVQTAPAAVTGFSAAGGANQASLSWPAVSGATSYNIYWSTTSGVTTATGTRIAGVSSPYVQTGLSAGTTYYYVITAVNSAGEGVASPQISATTTQAPVTLDGRALYNQYCSGCHATGKLGKPVATIQKALASIGAMAHLKTLTLEQITAISAAK